MSGLTNDEYINERGYKSGILKNQGLMARMGKSLFPPKDPEIEKPMFPALSKDFEEMKDKIRKEVKAESIIADWLFGLSWKMQTICLEMLRGPDTHHTPTVKKLARWCRVQLIKNADPNTSFMKKGVDEIKYLSLEDISDELEYCTGHYIAHFVQMIACIGYFHPDTEIGLTAMKYYKHIVEHDLHLNVETRDEMERRLK